MQGKGPILYFFLLMGSTMWVPSAKAQGCPPNIGFEKGTFEGWECFGGQVTPDGTPNLIPVPPNGIAHTMLENTTAQFLDPFGQFPVNCPNGSGYSIQLGNSATGAKAESITYTFTIPDTQNDYSIIYNYAVVLDNPSPNTQPHAPHQMPKFSSKVFDVSANKYIDCGSFEFVTSTDLPGFKQSQTRAYTFYKDWAPITIKLSGYAGKTIRLEFSTNDCTFGGHFGYAYLDVNENCSSPISGNTFCEGTTGLSMKAPYGFQGYRWFNKDFTKLLGTENILRTNPSPPAGSLVALEITPYPNQGCLDTLYTKVQSSTDFFKLQTQDSLADCKSNGVDLTAAKVTTGSSPGITFSYFMDPNELNFLGSPKKVVQAGTYYIKGTNTAGCTDTKPVVVALINANLKVTNPDPVCLPTSINLTADSLIKSDQTSNVFSYWKDAAATQTLPRPDSVTTSNTYYVKVVGTLGCTEIVPITATVSAPPVSIVRNIVGCGDQSLELLQPAAGSDPSATLSYWQDAATTLSLPGNHVFKTTTNYFIKLTNASGCAVTKPAQVSVHPFPVFNVAAPMVTIRPATVSLLETVPYSPNWNYSYWLDSLTTKVLSRPSSVATSGRYFIKATTLFGCNTTKPVQVEIKDPPVVPPNVFTPNADGVNDTWEIPILQFYEDCAVEVYNRTGQLLYRSQGYSKPWDGKINGKTLPFGTYYYLISLSKKHPRVSGSVTLLK